MQTDESGRVALPPKRTVADVVGHRKYAATVATDVAAGFTEDQIATMIAAVALGDVLEPCPRCGVPVELHRGAELGSRWHCSACGAYGTIEDT